jgi:hypothetical protein
MERLLLADSGNKLINSIEEIAIEREKLVAWKR